MRVNDAAEHLQMSRAATYRMAATGQLPIVRIGRTIRIPVQALDEWLEAQTRLATSPPTGRTDRRSSQLPETIVAPSESAGRRVQSPTAQGICI